jgi:hypothetical protein
LQDTPKFTPNWDFWFENIPSGNPAAEQGDQLGPIFAIRDVFIFGQFYENEQNSPNVWTIFSLKKLWAKY